MQQSGCDVTTLGGDRRVARRFKGTEPESQSEQTCHRAPEVVCAVECCSLRKANLRVSGLYYIAGATHGLPCTEVILCVVVCVLGPCHCVVPAVDSAGAGAVIRGNCRESTLSPRQSLSPQQLSFESCIPIGWKACNCHTSQYTHFEYTFLKLGRITGSHFSLTHWMMLKHIYISELVHHLIFHTCTVVHDNYLHLLRNNM